jgi:hypothetical protein
MTVVANILDPAQETLDPTVWDAVNEYNPVLKFQHKSWIMDTITSTLKRHGYGDMDKWLETYLTGSLTTFQYSDESDCDVSIFVNTDVFPEWSRAEMIGIMVSEVDGTILPGTTHPMQCYVVAKGIRPEDLYKPGLRSGYEIQNDRWVVPPEHDRVHDVASSQNADYQYALEQADKMERLLHYEPNKAIQFWHQIHLRRMSDQKAGKGDYAQSNIIYKFLANRGLMPAISDLTGEHIAALTESNPLPRSLDDHWLTWQPGAEGKGFILENGRVWTWPTQDLRPMHLNRSAPVKAMGGRVRPETAFHINPDGGVFQVGPGRHMDHIDQARLAMADSRLKPVSPPDTGGYGHSQDIYEKLKNSRAAGAPPPWSVNPNALEQAGRHLGLHHPVKINLVKGTRGQYQGLGPDGHEIDVVSWLKPESASKQIWHEMTHALQHERDPHGFQFGMQGYWDAYHQSHGDYLNHPWEVEARQTAEAHPFPVVHGIRAQSSLSDASTTNKGPHVGQAEAHDTSQPPSQEAWSFC